MGLLQSITAAFKKRINPPQNPAVACYTAIVAGARQPRLYSQLAVPDTPQGRFEMVMLHAWMVIDHLAAAEPEFTQDLFNLIFTDFDENLRELGVGDLAIGHRVKGWAAAFYGRAAAYKSALFDESTLADTLARNVFAGIAPPDRDTLRQLAFYVRTAHQAVAGMPVAAVKAGTIKWPE